MEPGNKPESKPSFAFRIAFPLCALLAGIAGVLLFFGKIPLGLEGSSFYFYRTSAELEIVSPPMLCGALALCAAGLLVALFGAKKLGGGWAIALLCALGLLLDFAAYRPLYLSWSARIMTNAVANANPFLPKGLEMESFLGYPAKHKAFAEKGYLQAAKEERRLTTYPPGLPMLYNALWRICSLSGSAKESMASAALCEGVLRSDIDSLMERRPRDVYALSFAGTALCLLASGLIPLLAFLAAKELSGDATLSLFAAFLSLLIPSLHLFNPLPDSFIASLWLLAVFSALRAARLNSLPLGALSGLAIAATLTLSFNALPLGFLCGALAIFACGLRQGLKLSAVMALPSLGLLLTSLPLGANLTSLFLTAMRNNSEFYASCGRTFLPSIWQNTLELFIFGGPAIAALFAVSAPGAISSLREWRMDKGIELGKAFLAALALCAAIALFGGGVRGEVARNCMALMPLLAIAVAACCGLDTKRLAIACAISALLLVETCCLIEANVLFRL